MDHDETAVKTRLSFVFPEDGYGKGARIRATLGKDKQDSFIVIVSAIENRIVQHLVVSQRRFANAA